MKINQLDLFGEKEEMIKGAFIDPTGTYRYNLWREWDKYKPRVTFIMLNPSTADASEDDPTIRRCTGFAKLWGFGLLEVVNLFAYRATIPIELKKCDDPFGPENAHYIWRAVLGADKIVCAWGTMGDLYSRSKSVCEMLEPSNYIAWELQRTVTRSIHFILKVMLHLLYSKIKNNRPKRQLLRDC